MFEHDYTITGKHATYLKYLAQDTKNKDKPYIFDRYIDVYMNAVVFGLLYGRVAKKDNESKDRARIYDVDLILVEGYKEEKLTKIGLCRAAGGQGFTSDLSEFIAIVTDAEDIDTELPKFDLDDIEGLADFILKNKDSFPHSHELGHSC